MRTALVLAVTLALAALPAHAQPETSPPPPTSSAPCEGSLHLAEYAFVVGGTSYVHLPDSIPNGTSVRVDFALTGCGTAEFSWVSYDAPADFALAGQTVHDAQTATFGPGNASLVVKVGCTYQLDFVVGGVLEHFDPPQVTYHAQERFIDGGTGSNDCAPPPCDAACAGIPCPTDLAAAAHADGSVTLTFTPPPGATTVSIARSLDGGPSSPLAELAGNATTYADTTSAAGHAYVYTVTASGDGSTSKDCATAALTVVPDLATPVALGIAGLATLGCAVVLRRR